MINKSVLFALIVLGFSTLACSPVIAISWNEFLIIGAIVALLLGPPLYRFIRRVEKALKRRNTEK